MECYTRSASAGIGLRRCAFENFETRGDARRMLALQRGHFLERIRQTGKKLSY